MALSEDRKLQLINARHQIGLYSANELSEMFGVDKRCIEHDIKDCKELKKAM